MLLVEGRSPRRDQLRRIDGRPRYDMISTTLVREEPVTTVATVDGAAGQPDLDGRGAPTGRRRAERAGPFRTSWALA